MMKQESIPPHSLNSTYRSSKSFGLWKSEVGDTRFRPTRHANHHGDILDDHIPRVLRARYRHWGDEAVRLPSEVMLFETLRAMNKVRPFKLVFLVMAPDSSLGEVRGSWRELWTRRLREVFSISLTPHPPSVADDIAMVVGHVF
jgi:hypothetical protein